MICILTFLVKNILSVIIQNHKKFKYALRRNLSDGVACDISDTVCVSDDQQK